MIVDGLLSKERIRTLELGEVALQGSGCVLVFGGLKGCLATTVGFDTGVAGLERRDECDLGRCVRRFKHQSLVVRLPPP